jgi:hypothetical protein
MMLCTVLMFTEYGEAPAVVNIGWGVERLMNWGLKNCNYE